MLRLSTETYNNKQVTKALRQNFSGNVPKMDYFGSISQKVAKRWEIAPRPLRLDSMNRECAKNLLPLNSFG